MIDMTIKYFRYCFVCALIVVLHFPSYLTTSAAGSRLLIICFDGFRHGYMRLYKPPNFMKFARGGIYASQGMIPVFPASTSPNMYAMVTGLYPESHGFIFNYMFNQETDEPFTYDDKSKISKWFKNVEPIWVTAKLHGLKTGSYFWFGGEIPLNGTTATFHTRYKKSIPFVSRIDTVVSWFANEDVQFATLYFEEPDTTGHRTGPFSEEVRHMVSRLDNLLGYLLRELEERELLASTNIILVSDHGMKTINRNPAENLLLRNYLATKLELKYYKKGPLSFIVPHTNAKVDSIYRKLKNAHRNFEVYLKKDIPKALHYSNNHRITPIIIVAKEGYVTAWDEDELNAMSIAQHSYSNAFLSMRAIFLAAGPDLRVGLRVKPFRNINVYSLMCNLLNLEPRPNNGSVDNIRHMLKRNYTSIREIA